MSTKGFFTPWTTIDFNPARNKYIYIYKKNTKINKQKCSRMAVSRLKTFLSFDLSRLAWHIQRRYPAFLCWCGLCGNSGTGRSESRTPSPSCREAHFHCTSASLHNKWDKYEKLKNTFPESVGFISDFKWIFNPSCAPQITTISRPCSPLDGAKCSLSVWVSQQ